MDPPDWPQIVRDHGPRVWRTARRLLGHDADDADCYQRTFLAAVELDSREGVRSWPAVLVRLATARALEQLRTRYRKSGRAGELPEELADDSPGGSDLASASELAAALRLAVAGIDPVQAQAFCLVCLEGESNVGAAEALGLSANHVGVLLFRAKAALRERLAAFDPAKEARP